MIMCDLIRICDLKVMVRLGVSEEERTRPQRIAISLELSVPDVTSAAVADDLSKAVDYFEVYKAVKEVASARPRQLVESLAHDIARAVLEKFTVVEVAVEIKKFIFPDTSHVALRIVRKNSEG